MLMLHRYVYGVIRTRAVAQQRLDWGCCGGRADGRGKSGSQQCATVLAVELAACARQINIVSQEQAPSQQLSCYF